MKACCENCRFWKYLGDKEGKYPSGLCRRYAPHPGLRDDDGDSVMEVAWPDTDGSDWCGEWQERPAEQSGLPPGQAIDEIKAELLKRKIKSEKIVGRHSRHDDLIGDRECNFHRGYAAAAEDVLEMLNAKFGKEDA